MLGDSPNYKLQKFIQGVVAKLIRSYKMTDFLYQSASGRKDSDFRDDLIQTAWVTALRVQQSHPEESKNPGYLRRAIVNDLIKTEQSDRKRRDTRDDVDETLPVEHKHDFKGYDVEMLMEKSRLTPTEQLVVELTYGLNDGKEYNVPQIARMMGKSEFYVEGRLRVAKMKMQVSVGR